MAKLDASTRTIQIRNFDLHYSADDFVNADSYSTDHRMNRAWIIHNYGAVLAIVFAEYYAYCDQDALDEACDRGKLDSLRVSDAELADYETGKDSEGNPEYEGIAYLGNASEPFDQNGLDYYTVSADTFRLDPVIMAVIEQQSREEAAERLQDCATATEDPDGYHQVKRIITYLNNEAEYVLMRDREEAAAGEWQVTCTKCGVLPPQIQRHDPVICPKCYGIDIETGPLVQADWTIVQEFENYRDFEPSQVIAIDGLGRITFDVATHTAYGCKANPAATLDNDVEIGTGETVPLEWEQAKAIIGVTLDAELDFDYHFPANKPPRGSE